MKNKLIYILTCLLMFSTTACYQDFLDIAPLDEPTVDGFYNNRGEIRSATATLYGRPWFEFNDKFSWAAGDGLAGDLYNDYQHEGQLFFFSYNNTNSIVAQGWRSLYNIIAYSNAITNDMPRVASNKGVSEEVINAAVGEARFIRAFSLYFLTEFWGEVPIIEDAASLVSANQINIPKYTKLSIYEFIKRDLEFAAQHLPTSDEPGRVTQWSAKGLLAKLYVTKGQLTKSDDDFNKAKEYAADVIQNSGLALMSNYADLFRIANNNNQETLFALQWISGSWGFGNSRQAVFGRNRVVTGNDEAWGGWKSATYSFLQNLRENATENGTVREDNRRKWIVMQSGDHYPEIRRAHGGYTYNIVVDHPTMPEYNSPLLNNIKKYIVGSQEDAGVTVHNQAVPLNQYMLRLADVYLIYAEAALGNGSSISDGLALQYYNAIRSRAGLHHRTSITFQDIFNERRVEFGMEGINWLDVKRYFYRNPEAAVQYLNDQNRAVTYERINNDNLDGNSVDHYQLVQPTTPVIVNASRMNLPIPLGEITNNPLLAASEPAVDYNFE